MVDGFSEDRMHNVLEAISRSPKHSQRTLAAETGLSLGMVNLILRRLVKTGHLKVSGLNKKKFEYLLTRKGLVEKAARTYQYVTRTIHTYRDYENRVDSIVSSVVADGGSQIVVLGDNEIAAMVRASLKARRILFKTGKPGEKYAENEMVLDCRFNGRQNVGISILEKLINDSREN